MQMKKIHYILFFLLCQLSQLNAQDFRFALITDTHIADNTSAAEDLKNSIEQINATPNLDFVLVTGDISENGDRKSLQIAHDLLSQLKINGVNQVSQLSASCLALNVLHLSIKVFSFWVSIAGRLCVWPTAMLRHKISHS